MDYPINGMIEEFEFKPRPTPNPYMRHASPRKSTTSLASVLALSEMMGMHRTGVSPVAHKVNGKNRKREKLQEQRRTRNKAAAASRKKNRRK